MDARTLALIENFKALFKKQAAPIAAAIEKLKERIAALEAQAERDATGVEKEIAELKRDFQPLSKKLSERGFLFAIRQSEEPSGGSTNDRNRSAFSRLSISRESSNS